MADKSSQPSHEPPDRKGKEGRGGENNDAASSCLNHMQECFNQRAHGNLMYAHVQKLLTTREC